MIAGAVKLAVLAVIAYFVVDKLFKYGVNLHFRKHHPGTCRQVKGPDYGSEDLQVTKDGLAFVSSGFSMQILPPGFREFIKSNNIRGRILTFDFNKPDAGAKELKIKFDKDSFNPETFRPHGISLLEDGVKGEHLLYVINHPEGEADRVEKFRYLPKTNELAHVKSFTGDLLRGTNDLAVLAEDKFYIDNFMYFTNNRVLSILEMTVLPIALGSLLFYNGSDFIEVISGLDSPNGLTLSKDNRYLYMNLPMIHSMNVYQRKGDNSLTLVQSLPLNTMGDNFHLSQSGDALYTGAHPIRYLAILHTSSPTHHAPSSVLKLPLQDGKVVSEDITELFYDHGDLISGSSIAAVYNNKLLIGSLIDKLVICDGKLQL